MRLPIQSMQAVRLRPVPSDSDAWHRSVIVDFTPDEELILVVPEDKDLVDEKGDAPDEEAEAEAPAVVGDDDVLPPPLFDRGTKIEVEISFPDGIRRFTSVVRRLELQYGGSMRVDWPTEGTRIQRRDYVRVEVGYRALVWYREGDGPLQKLTGATMDISAGGVRLKLTTPLESGQRIEIEIDNSVLKGKTVQGRVVHCGEIEKKRGQPDEYWIAVEFVGIGEAMRKDMTQMVFDIQREQMKRSLA